jgi:hypothetical protein
MVFRALAAQGQCQAGEADKNETGCYAFIHFNRLYKLPFHHARKNLKIMTTIVESENDIITDIALCWPI